MSATFNGNPCQTSVSCQSPIDASDESDIAPFDNGLSSRAWYIHKHNVVIIDGDMIAHIVKDENNFALYLY